MISSYHPAHDGTTARKMHAGPAVLLRLAGKSLRESRSDRRVRRGGTSSSVEPTRCLQAFVWACADMILTMQHR
jgi:hypothetical protein